MLPRYLEGWELQTADRQKDAARLFAERIDRGLDIIDLSPAVALALLTHGGRVKSASGIARSRKATSACADTCSAKGWVASTTQSIDSS